MPVNVLTSSSLRGAILSKFCLSWLSVVGACHGLVLVCIGLLVVLLLEHLHLLRTLAQLRLMGLLLHEVVLVLHLTSLG